MNLSVLEKMVRDGDLSLDGLRYLLECHGECEWLDYKKHLGIEHDQELCAFTKDALALKNVGGGYIVVGVEDKTWIPCGLSSKLPYDSKMLHDKIRRCAGVELDVDIVHHEIQDIGNIAIIYVRSSRKRSKRRMPTLVAKDYCPNAPFGIRRGDIWIRRGDSTVKVQSQVELEELIEHLEASCDQDAIQATEQPSPFAIQDGPYRLLDRGFDSFIGREALKQQILEAVTRDPRIWIVNVHGPGGVGKSAVVNWVTYEFYHRRAFEAILQLTAKETILTPEGIKPFGRSLYSLENFLDHIIDLIGEKTPQDIEAKKHLALDILGIGETLLVLDNMESVSDGRVLKFVQELPNNTKAKVLITSRQKTGGWEMPIAVNELSDEETGEFLKVKARDMGVSFPLHKDIVSRVRGATGGLPLAIQWMIGQYKITKDIAKVLTAVVHSDSPVLEFSFRNIWHSISPDAKAMLAIMTIFDVPPTIQLIATVTQWNVERIDKALAELMDVTLVTRVTQLSDGRVVYSALPITLSFARHQLDVLGDFVTRGHQRLQQYSEQMALQESEVSKFRSTFEYYGLTTDNEKKAAILCRRGESEMFAGNADNADVLFKQARDLAPQSAYILAMSASCELARGRVGLALVHSQEACRRATNKTGSLCYKILARIHDAQYDKLGRIDALEKALEYDNSDVVARHQYGVALSRGGRPEDAIREFSRIITDEKEKASPTETLMMALKTRIINLRRLDRYVEADEDMAYAGQLLKDNPYLQHHAWHFADLEDDR
ncbi:MAG: NB-ARC domain-containing protein [Dehalococcoidia bacterium]|nr:NB-ARC domain-containing protein [Dehalococcoidia bacterium]